MVPNATRGEKTLRALVRPAPIRGGVVRPADAKIREGSSLRFAGSQIARNSDYRLQRTGAEHVIEHGMNSTMELHAAEHVGSAKQSASTRPCLRTTSQRQSAASVLPEPVSASISATRPSPPRCAMLCRPREPSTANAGAKLHRGF